MHLNKELHRADIVDARWLNSDSKNLVDIAQVHSVIKQSGVAIDDD